MDERREDDKLSSWSLVAITSLTLTLLFTASILVSMMLNKNDDEQRLEQLRVEYKSLIRESEEECSTRMQRINSNFNDYIFTVDARIRALENSPRR